jgi:hypothetical protein
VAQMAVKKQQLFDFQENSQNNVVIGDNLEFLTLEAFQGLSRIQEEFDKTDTDTFMNEVRDSVAAKYLGYTHINIEKHGLDGRRKSKHSGFDYDYLEVKTASFEAQSWQATFNDTTLEKAGIFTQKNVYLAFSVWKGAADLLFVVYGQNEELGHFLAEKIPQQKAKGQRQTQTVSISTLVNDFGMIVYSVSKTPEELYSLFQMKNACKKIKRSSIRSIEDIDSLVVAETEMKYLFKENDYLIAAESEIGYTAKKRDK